MMVADSLSALAVVVLAVLFASDVAQMWHVYVIMLVRATCAAFHWPAMQASATLMVPQEHLARVAGMNQALQGLGAIVAPPIGAMLLAILPVQSILAIDVLTAAIAVAPLFLVQVPRPARAGPSTASRPSMLSDLRAGVNFLRGWPGILMVICIAVIVNLLAFPAIALQPLLVTDHFGGDAPQLALLQSAFGIGMVAGGVTLGAWGGFRKRSLTGLLALALNGVGLTVVGLAPASAFPLAVGGMLFAWFMNPIANGSLFAMLQTIVPAEMQGRVFTLLNSAAGLMAPLGLAIAGPLGDVLGVRVWFLIAGLAMTVLGIGALFVPAIVSLDQAPTVSRQGSVAAAETPGLRAAAQ
jgi:DHA3 family macrolide efflux protein-like MFS transporter